MSLKIATSLISATMLLLSANLSAASAASLRISGAAAVAGNIIIPNKAAIEKETGLTLEVTANGDGNGMMDLYAGRVDVMMVAAPIKVTEDILNKKKPGSVSAAGFEVAPVGAIGIKFIVNAANPVKSLTEAQLKDIFIGKITSWKQVGGDDRPIMVVAESPGLGTRSNVVASMLGGAEIKTTDPAFVKDRLSQIGLIVSSAPDAISYGNTASIALSNITNELTVVPGVEVKQALGLATKGPPSAEVKKLIDVVAKYGVAVK